MKRKSLARFVKHCRNEIGLSQAELASALGTTRSVIANWESGRSEPRTTEFFKLRRFLKRRKFRLPI